MRPIVTSASEHEEEEEEEENSLSSSSSDDDDAWSENDAKRNVYFPDDLLDETADEQDEAYVYKHLRSGMLEPVTVRQEVAAPTNHPHHQRHQSQPQKQHEQGSAKSRTTTLQVLKPRSSDAVLSCPCCFTIVSMDCQRHERFLNQFRAVFVMNIEVNWQETWVYSELQQGLIKHSSPLPLQSTAQQQQQQVECADDGRTKSLPVHYYTVNCSHCQTQVAVLDMTDEVYHFTGCLASS